LSGQRKRIRVPRLPNPRTLVHFDYLVSRCDYGNRGHGEYGNVSRTNRRQSSYRVEVEALSFGENRLSCTALSGFVIDEVAGTNLAVRLDQAGFHFDVFHHHDRIRS
jgi:hypothetical protein